MNCCHSAQKEMLNGNDDFFLYRIKLYKRNELFEDTLVAGALADLFVSGPRKNDEHIQ